MSAPDPLFSFGRLEEAAVFFIHCAFEYMQSALQLEVAAEIFSELIENIEPEPDWVVPQIPTTLPEVLHSNIAGYNGIC